MTIVVEPNAPISFALNDEIEPSEKGGGKIANAVVRLVSEHDFESHRTEVFI